MPLLRILRIVGGTVLIAVSTLPLYGYLERLAHTGLAGTATAELVGVQADVIWSGALVIVLVGILGGLFLPPGFWSAVVRRMTDMVERPSSAVVMALLAGVAVLVTASFTLLALDGKPNLVDAMAQLFHARYLAAGRLAGPVPDEPAFWFIHNTVLAENGWASQYPPTHPVLLALGLRVGAVALLPAALMAVSAVFTYLVVRRLLPSREALARISGLGVAVSPFLVSQTGSYMNHGSATTLSVLAVYFALRARDGGAGWAVPLGAVLGLQLANRPLVALVVGLAVVAPVAMGAARRGVLTRTGVGSRIGLAVVGGLPFVAAFLAYNASVFGGSFDTGYVLTWGESTGLGFHTDPWGNVYSPLTALAYTSADLTSLSLALLETPFPIIALVGLWWASAERIREGEGILLAWALAPVAANFFYWHHGHFMGPRMLTEAAPAWIALTILMATRFFDRLPESLPGSTIRLSPRQAFATGTAATVLAAAYLGPVRLANRGGEYMESVRAEAPSLERPSLVFVHDGWNGRVIGRLASAGLPPYEIEAALAGTDICRLQQALDERGSRADLRRRLADAAEAELVDLTVYPGQNVMVSRARVGATGLRLPHPCARQLAADRLGTVHLAPFLWRGGLPGLEGDRTVYVRDLGPGLNAGLLSHYPDWPRYYLVRETPEAAPRLLPYDEGSRRLWAGPGEASAPRDRN